MNRREILQTAMAAALLGGRTDLFAASDFWNRKPASEWSGQEVEELLTRSPWAKDVNAEFINDADYTTGGNSGPVIGRGGAIDAPGSGSASQVKLGGNAREAAAGPKTRVPVTVRWESAQPIRDAAASIRLSATLKDRYVVSVSGLPLGVMDKPSRGLRTEPTSADNSAEARQRRMVEALSGSATLLAKGQEPEQAGVVEPAPKAPGTYLFGFSRELLPIDTNSREIVFTLETALMTVKAKFDTKAMLYRGHLAL